MSDCSSHPLVREGVALYRSFMANAENRDLESDLPSWAAYMQEIAAFMAHGPKDPQVNANISLIVGNVRTLASSRSRLDEIWDEEFAALSAKVEDLAVEEEGRSGKRRYNPHDSNNYRTSKRNCRPITTKYLPTPSPPPPSTKSLKSTPSTIQPPAQDPVRLFFLTHLSNPYPTPTEKEKLCKKAQITRRKLESDLTNWRRRSDWTDIMNTYCGGDKGSMRKMVSAIERGEEKDVELLERFGRMRAYLEKRDEQAGEWVLKLAEMVKTGRLDEMRFQQVNDGDNSENDSNSGSDSEDDGQDQQDEDAEGESEDGYRYQPANIPNSTMKSGIAFDNQVETPYITVPLTTTLNSPPIKFSPDTPLTELSPISSIGSHISAIPFSQQVQHQHQHQHPPAQYITYEHQPSTKSSYSSISAASAAAGSRKRNISDSSTSSNLRSTSGSSTSSYQTEEKNPKRPAKTSFSRSSRSRVEDILIDHSTAPTWVTGHSPNQGFHIGADPAFIHQHPLPHPHPPPHQAQGQGQAPPPYEMGPYLMAPDAWNNNIGYDWTIASTPTSGGGGATGGFTIPADYDFTFSNGSGYGYGNGQGQGGVIEQR